MKESVLSITETTTQHCFSHF